MSPEFSHEDFGNRGRRYKIGDGAGVSTMTEAEALDKAHQALALQLDSRHREALDCLEPAAAYFAENDGPQSPDLANLLLEQAESLLALCRYQDAETAARHATAILRSVRDLLDAETRAGLLPRAFALVYGVGPCGS